MNKAQIIQKFITLIEQILNQSIESQKTTVDYLTHEDNKPENKYDTRSLEASYLARGQAERVADLKECLSLFKNTALQNYSEKTPIGNTALVKLSAIENPDDIKNVLLMPKGGGLAIDFEQQAVQIVTPASPLGKALIGKKSGDEINYKTGDKVHEYEILSVS